MLFSFNQQFFGNQLENFYYKHVKLNVDGALIFLMGKKSTEISRYFGAQFSLSFFSKKFLPVRQKDRSNSSIFQKSDGLRGKWTLKVTRFLSTCLNISSFIIGDSHHPKFSLKWTINEWNEWVIISGIPKTFLYSILFQWNYRLENIKRLWFVNIFCYIKCILFKQEVVFYPITKSDSNCRCYFLPLWFISHMIRSYSFLYILSLKTP